jgi:transcriptional regulator with XRE-family HTH domain
MNTYTFWDVSLTSCQFCPSESACMPRSHHSVEFETLRLKTGLSQAETADLLGVTERTVIRYENGESRPSPIAIKWLQERVAVLSTGLVRVSILGSRIDCSDQDASRESARVRSVAASNATSRKLIMRRRGALHLRVSFFEFRLNNPPKIPGHGRFNTHFGLYWLRPVFLSKGTSSSVSDFIAVGA